MENGYSLDRRLFQASFNARVKNTLRPLLKDFEEVITKIETEEEKQEAANLVLEMLRISFQDIYVGIGTHINRGEKR